MGNPNDGFWRDTLGIYIYIYYIHHMKTLDKLIRTNPPFGSKKPSQMFFSTQVCHTVSIPISDGGSLFRTVQTR